jgi:hypothetical protein
MISNLKTLRESVIFLIIGTRKLSFIRFAKNKIVSSKSYDITPNSSQDELKLHFRDYFLGKDGIPVCIVFDIPNQSFTEYRFLKSIGASAIHQSIIKKISNDIPQEAIHDYIKIQDPGNAKKGENIFQVTSLVKTPLVAICIDLLHKFPNPIAGYFSNIIEMPSICDGRSLVPGFTKPAPVVEQDALDVRERHEDDINISVQYSDYAIVNFALYQNKRILFHHSIVCSEITKDVQKEINSTMSTAIDYAKQLNKECYVYVYGSQSFLRNILETTFDPKIVYFIQSDLPNTKAIYHRSFITQSTVENNALHITSYKCLTNATHFVENKEFFATHAKYKMIKLGSFFSLLALCLFAIYEFFAAYPALVMLFGDAGKMPSINVRTVTKNITEVEQTTIKQKYLVMLYTNLANDGYSQFRTKFDPLVNGDTHLTKMMYTCKSECNSGNADIAINISAKTKDMTTYYSFISEVQRAFYNYNVAKQTISDKKSDNIQFTLDISAQTTNTKSI